MCDHFISEIASEDEAQMLEIEKNLENRNEEEFLNDSEGLKSAVQFYRSCPDDQSLAIIRRNVVEPVCSK